MDPEWRDFDRVRTSLSRDTGTLSKVYGGRGSLEISLQGKQIEAFAELIREVAGAD